MQLFASPSTKHYASKIYGIASRPKVLLFKEDENLFYRSGFLVMLKPLQIPLMHPFTSVFSAPYKVTFNVQLFDDKGLGSFVTYFFIDTDLSDCPKKNYNSFLASSLKEHVQHLDLLRKNIAIKNLDTKVLSANQALDFSFSDIPKSVKKYAYKLEFEKEVIFLRKAMFSHPSMKQIDYEPPAFLPTAEILLGTSLYQKPIGVTSHVLFLTGQKERRRSIITTLLNHFTKQDDYHIVIVDFGLNLTPDKLFFREFQFEDILFDPFSFKETFTEAQRSLLVSHLSFIGRSILRLNERQIGLLEDKLSAYVEQENTYSWSSFMKFSEDEASDDLLTNPAGIASFTKDTVSTDFTSTLKTVDDPLKSLDRESLQNKLRYLDRLFTSAHKTSLPDIFFKNHLDIFTIATAPDLKSLAFYLCNLFYCLHEKTYKQFKFMFLNIDTILFDKFTEIDMSWLHPDIKNSLFDANHIDLVKKLFNQIETRIYTSFNSSTQSTLIPKFTRERIEQLQDLQKYSVLESPLFQQPEYFKLVPEEVPVQLDLPPIKVFMVVAKLVFSRIVDYSYRVLVTRFDMNRHLLKQVQAYGYLQKHSRNYVVTNRALELKKAITDFIAYQPALSVEETNTLVAFSDPVKYNPFRQSIFSFEGNIDHLCTRYLAHQLTTGTRLNYFLVYHFLSFKQHKIDEQKLLYYLILAVQLQQAPKEVEQPKIDFTTNTTSDSPVPEPVDKLYPVPEEPEQQAIPTSKLDINHEYFATRSDQEEPSLSREEPVHQTTQVGTPKIAFTFPEHIQEAVDTINRRIQSVLPNSNFSFPHHPLFLIMKSLNQDTIDLINIDLQNLSNETIEDTKITSD